MTKLYALLKLLEHGSLTYLDIREITRWDAVEVQPCIDAGIAAGAIRRLNKSNAGNGCIRFALRKA